MREVDLEYLRDESRPFGEDGDSARDVDNLSGCVTGRMVVPSSSRVRITSSSSSRRVNGSKDARTIEARAARVLAFG